MIFGTLALSEQRAHTLKIPIVSTPSFLPKLSGLELELKSAVTACWSIYFQAQPCYDHLQDATDHPALAIRRHLPRRRRVINSISETALFAAIMGTGKAGLRGNYNPGGIASILVSCWNGSVTPELDDARARVRRDVSHELIKANPTSAKIAIGGAFQSSWSSYGKVPHQTPTISLSTIMSNLQKDFLKAKLKSLPRDPPMPTNASEHDLAILTEHEDDPDYFDNIPPSPSALTDDSSSASSASSTSTIRPSIFSRPVQ